MIGISDLLSAMSNRTAHEKERTGRASTFDMDGIGHNKVPLASIDAMGLANDPATRSTHIPVLET